MGKLVKESLKLVKKNPCKRKLLLAHSLVGNIHWPGNWLSVPKSFSVAFHYF